eukprot:IDg21377t1
MCVCTQPLHGRAGDRDYTHAQYNTGTCLQRCAINTATVYTARSALRKGEGGVSAAARQCQTRVLRAKFTRQCCHNVFPATIELSFDVKKAQMTLCSSTRRRTCPSRAVCTRTDLCSLCKSNAVRERGLHTHNSSRAACSFTPTGRTDIKRV